MADKATITKEPRSPGLDSAFARAASSEGAATRTVKFPATLKMYEPYFTESQRRRFDENFMRFTGEVKKAEDADSMRVKLRNGVMDDVWVMRNNVKWRGIYLINRLLEANISDTEKVQRIIAMLNDVERADPELAIRIRTFIEKKNIKVRELDALRRMDAMAREKDARKAVSAIAQNFAYFNYVLKEFKDQKLADELLAPLADVQKANRLIGRKIAFLEGFVRESYNWRIDFNYFRNYVGIVKGFLDNLIRMFADKAARERIEANDHVKHFLHYLEEDAYIARLEELERRGAEEANWKDFFTVIDEIRKKKEAHELVGKYGDKPLVKRFIGYWEQYKYWPGRNEREGWMKAFYEIRRDFRSREHIEGVIDDGRKAIITILIEEIRRLNEMLERIARKEQGKIEKIVKARISIIERAPHSIRDIVNLRKKELMSDLKKLRVELKKLELNKLLPAMEDFFKIKSQLLSEFNFMPLRSQIEKVSEGQATSSSAAKKYGNGVRGDLPETCIYANMLLPFMDRLDVLSAAEIDTIERILRGGILLNQELNNGFNSKTGILGEAITEVLTLLKKNGFPIKIGGERE